MKLNQTQTPEDPKKELPTPVQEQAKTDEAITAQLYQTNDVSLTPAEPPTVEPPSETPTESQGARSVDTASRVAERNEMVEWLITNGFPALPVAPFQPDSGFTGKNPSWMDSDGYHRKLGHGRFQSKLPTEGDLSKWFRDDSVGVGTLGGWNNTVWIDFDVKDFRPDLSIDWKYTSATDQDLAQQNCDRAVSEWLSGPGSVCNTTFAERTQSGGYRFGVLVRQEPFFTLMTLDPGHPKVGEALGKGRFTVLSPTIGPSGKAYTSIRRCELVWVDSLESIGIYPAKEEPKGKTAKTAKTTKTTTDDEPPSDPSDPVAVERALNALIQQLVDAPPTTGNDTLTDKAMAGLSLILSVTDEHEQDRLRDHLHYGLRDAYRGRGHNDGDAEFNGTWRSASNSAVASRPTPLKPRIDNHPKQVTGSFSSTKVALQEQLSQLLPGDRVAAVRLSSKWFCEYMGYAKGVGSEGGQRQATGALLRAFQGVFKAVGLTDSEMKQCWKHGNENAVPTEFIPKTSKAGKTDKPNYRTVIEWLREQSSDTPGKSLAETIYLDMMTTYQMVGTQKIDEMLVTALANQFADEFELTVVPKHLIITAIETLAHRNPRHPFREYLTALAPQDDPDVWTRVQSWYGLSDLTVEGLRLCFKQAVLGFMQRGAALEIMPILCGKQGTGKTSFITEMFKVGPEFQSIPTFTELPTSSNPDSFLNILGAPVFVLDEAKSGLTGRCIENTKALMSQISMCIRKPYDRTPTTIHREWTYWATSNESDILSDKTGNRRFLPLNWGTASLGKAWAREIQPFIASVRDRVWACAVWDSLKDASMGLSQRLRSAMESDEYQFQQHGTDDVLSIAQAKYKANRMATKSDPNVKTHAVSLSSINSQIREALGSGHKDSQTRKILEMSGWVPSPTTQTLLYGKKQRNVLYPPQSVIDEFELLYPQQVQTGITTG
jgi:Virulence-associated protein E